MTEVQLVELFWNRREEAIAETDAAFGKKLRGLSYRILQNREDSEEVVNDTFLKTWNSIPTARPQNLSAYLCAICRRLSLNMLDWKRAGKRKAEIVAITAEMEQCIPDSREENRLESQQIAEIMNRFLETLPKESRVVFLRRYWFADSVADIAKRYSFTESKVKMQLSRTRARLKDYLEKEGISI